MFYSFTGIMLISGLITGNGLGESAPTCEILETKFSVK